MIRNSTLSCRLRAGTFSMCGLFLIGWLAGTQPVCAQAAEAPPAAAAKENKTNELPASKSKPITLPLSPELKRIFQNAPRDVKDLKAMQNQIQAVAGRAIPTTVAIRLDGAMGSGVIISEDGYVLTAGHVVTRPNSNVTFVLHNGRVVKGKTLGANYRIDSGLMKIEDEGPFPYAELGNTSDVRSGQWCLGIGHPGGFDRNRPPPLRIGRVLIKQRGTLITDCALVGGDSGGPLLDMEGKVIGIHSRIADDIKINLHVPVDTYRDTWDRLAKGNTWGGLRPGGPVIGVAWDEDSEKARIGGVVDDSPADEAGIRVGDVITRFDGKKIAAFSELADAVFEKEPGDKVKIELLREDETIEVELVIGRLGE